MNTPIHAPQPRSGHHPVMIAAAIAIVLFCLAGTAAILGWIPSSIGRDSNNSLSEADKATLSSKMEQDSRMSAPALAMAPAELPPASPPPAPRLRDADAQALPAPAPERELRHAPAKVAETSHEKAWCGSCGNVQSVRAIKTRAEGSGLGAGAGAVLGGLLGHQVGGGHGKQLATAAGAVGGAVIGNQVEGNMKATTSYEIRVRLDDGSTRTFHQQSAPRWAEGDRVKIVNGALHSA